MGCQAKSAIHRIYHVLHASLSNQHEHATSVLPGHFLYLFSHLQKSEKCEDASRLAAIKRLYFVVVARHEAPGAISSEKFLASGSVE